ncbi:MAG: ABC transporter permease [Anaerolineales bacterium]|nr:ABC transporter permease [Anaerolineales bacterium]MCB0005457.1 ABC transporter permease [Anaerolineales bacterium]MCB0015398.1 ABC transporter permease [Anaerolineales bacterium]
MKRYLLSRLLQSVLLMIGVIVIVFFLIRLTGDPVSLMIPKEAPAEAREAFREANGFNRPILVQFFDYFFGVLRGDLGTSIKYRQPSLDLISQRFPQTFWLATLALFLAVLFAVPIGIFGGFNPGSLVDTLGRTLGLAGQSTPSFVLALYLILFFSVNLRWLPTLFERGNLATIIMPAVALSIGGMGQLVRLTRSAVLEIRNEDYIRTARSKGLTGYLIGARHVARNASLAIISVLSILYTYSMAGTILIESIFAYPGLGNLLNGALIDRDFFLIQAIAIVFAFFALTIRFVTDIIYAIVDPRIRYG